jgi:hypothetical protein
LAWPSTTATGPSYPIVKTKSSLESIAVSFQSPGNSQGFLFLYGGRKIVLADAADRTDPVVRDGFKRDARSYAADRVSVCGVVHITTYITHIFLHIYSSEGLTSSYRIVMKKKNLVKGTA